MLVKEKDELHLQPLPLTVSKEVRRAKSQRLESFSRENIGRLPDGNTQYSADCFRWLMNGSTGQLNGKVSFRLAEVNRFQRRLVTYPKGIVRPGATGHSLVGSDRPSAISCSPLNIKCSTEPLASRILCLLLAILAILCTREIRHVIKGSL